MDDLTRINGIGKATAERLAAAGFDSFEKLAHDAVASEGGIRAEWIAEAARLYHENTQGKPPSPDDEEGGAGPIPADGGVGDPHTDTQESSGTAREASSTDSGTTAETPSVGVQPGSQPDASQGGHSGAGHPAGPAGFAGLTTEFLQVDPDSAGPSQLVVGNIEEEFRADFPNLAAAFDAWILAGRAAQSITAIRIASKRPGFRRCNVDHPKGPVDHPVDRFAPEELERLLAEPVLTVELV